MPTPWHASYTVFVYYFALFCFLLCVGHSLEQTPFSSCSSPHSARLKCAQKLGATSSCTLVTTTLPPPPCFSFPPTYIHTSSGFEMLPCSCCCFGPCAQAACFLRLAVTAQHSPLQITYQVPLCFYLPLFSLSNACCCGTHPFRPPPPHCQAICTSAAGRCQSLSRTLSPSTPFFHFTPRTCFASSASATATTPRLTTLRSGCRRRLLA